jgi:hypothetical protein
MSRQPQFPDLVRVNDRAYFFRHKIEGYKRALLALALGVEASDAVETEPAVVELVPAGQFARELGIHRRTLGRRIKGAKPDKVA